MRNKFTIEIELDTSYGNLSVTMVPLEPGEAEGDELLVNNNHERITQAVFQALRTLPLTGAPVAPSQFKRNI